MTTPAEELRAAVTVLRCDHRFPVQPPEGSLARPGDCRGCGIAHSRETAPDWLTEPLAYLLEQIAHGAEQHAAQEWGNDQIEIAGGPPLAVARVILDGSTP